jgi:hypothetical protein
MTETTPSQKYHANMGMILSGYEATDVYCFDICGHAQAWMDVFKQNPMWHDRKTWSMNKFHGQITPLVHPDYKW